MGQVLKGVVRLCAFFVAMAWSAFSWAELRVLMVSPEQTKILQSGGLAHATTGLGEALNAEGVRTEFLMPYYLQMNAPAHRNTGQTYSVDLDWRDGKPHKKSTFSLVQSIDPKSPTYFLKHESGTELNYFDNRTAKGGKTFYAPEAFIGESFGAFAKAAADFILSQNYDLVIINDWTTGLIATHLAEARAQGKKVPKVVFAIHNLAYQGLFPKSLVDFLGLSEKHFKVQGYEYWGKVSFLKAGLQYSNMIYTVSPQYALEIATPRSGAGMDGIIREKMMTNQVAGILNGITNHEWDPAIPQKGLGWTFTVDDLSGKAKGKLDLQKSWNLPVNADVPVFILTSRMAEQKGFEYLVGAVSQAAEKLNAQFIVMGDGDEKYIEAIKKLQDRFPDKVRYSAFSSQNEKQMTRYADFFVNGAWFEPSGLNQLFALKNGTLPVVSAAGGLKNSVREGETGILFEVTPGANGEPYDTAATQASALRAFERAVLLFKDKELVRKMRRQSMLEDNSWRSRVLSEFLPFFEYVLKEGYKKSSLPEFKGTLLNYSKRVDNSLMKYKTAPQCGKVHGS